MEVKKVELSASRPQRSVPSQRNHPGLLSSMARYFLMVPIDLELLLDCLLEFFLENSQDHSNKLTKSLQSDLKHLKKFDDWQYHSFNVNSY